MRKYILFFIGFFSLAGFSNPQIDALFRDYDKPGVPGAAVAVLKDGVTLYEKGYGLREVETGEKTTARTNFRMASVSKQFTAMAILLLIDQGKLTLETTLKEVFPEFPNYGSKIKIRHLLGHTGGLVDYEEMVSGSEQILDSGVLKLMMKQSGPAFSPGSQYRYSNGGYCVLSQVVERVSGISFGEFTQKYLFNAIGMADTQFYVKGQSVIPERAYGYTASGSGFTKTDQSNTSATMGDGGVYTSAHEWVRWDNALTNSQLISKELQSLMFTPGVLNDGSKTNYGFGYVIDSYKGHRRQNHTGSTIGFRTAVQRFPDERLTILVMINRANTSPWSMAERIADLYLNE